MHLPDRALGAHASRGMPRLSSANREWGNLIATATYELTAPFIGFDEFKDQTQPGCGVLVRLDGRVFLATAGHCVRQPGFEQTAAYLFLPGSGRPDNVAFKPLNTWLRGGDKDVDEVWDLACVEFQSDLPERIGRSAVPLDRIDLDWTPSPNEGAFVLGLSEDLIQHRTHQETGHPMTIFGGNGYISRPLPSAPRRATLRSDIDVFIEYESEMVTSDSKIVPSHSPVGLSGGGVWALNEEKATLWHAGRMRLVGLVRTSHRKESWVRATKMKHWFDLLNESTRPRVGS